MPYTIRKLKNRNCYSVKSPKRIHSRCTTLKKAKAQVRLLNALEKKGGYRQYSDISNYEMPKTAGIVWSNIRPQYSWAR
jgi:hypothetical protein